MKEQSQVVDNHRKYAYVSLFGINSLDELKVAIYQSAIELDQLNDQKEKSNDGIASNSKFDVLGKWRKFRRHGKAIAKGVADNTSAPVVGSLSKIYNVGAD